MSKIQDNYLVLMYDVEMQSNTTVPAICCNVDNMNLNPGRCASKHSETCHIIRTNDLIRMFYRQQEDILERISLQNCRTSSRNILLTAL